MGAEIKLITVKLFGRALHLVGTSSIIGNSHASLMAIYEMTDSAEQMLLHVKTELNLSL